MVWPHLASAEMMNWSTITWAELMKSPNWASHSTSVSGASLEYPDSKPRQATSRIEHLSESRFFPVLSEPRIDEEKVTRLVLCSGKIFYDLKGHATRENNEGVAISRVELLYPFPQTQIEEEIARYPNLREVVWVQEEPRNMGARAHMSPRLLQMLPSSLEFGYIGRPERASPGEGYPAAHTAEQNRILRTALDLGIPVGLYPKKLPGDR